MTHLIAIEKTPAVSDVPIGTYIVHRDWINACISEVMQLHKFVHGICDRFFQRNLIPESQYQVDGCPSQVTRASKRMSDDENGNDSKRLHLDADFFIDPDADFDEDDEDDNEAEDDAPEHKLEDLADGNDDDSKDEESENDADAEAVNMARILRELNDEPNERQGGDDDDGSQSSNSRDNEQEEDYYEYEDQDQSEDDS